MLSFHVHNINFHAQSSKTLKRDKDDGFESTPPFTVVTQYSKNE